MLTFPRALVPITPATVMPLVGTVMPRNLPGRSLIAQFLIELTGTVTTAEQDQSTLDPDQIAKAASISPRYLHKLFQDTELTPMRLVKRLRLKACRRCLEDPALTMTPIGVSAKQVRQSAGQRPSRSEK